MRLEAGDPRRLGARVDRDGTAFAVYASGAEAVELCLFDARDRETARLRLPARDDGVWHGYLPGCRAGQRYGFRAHGPWAPERGQRYNAHKLLLDPWTRRIAGAFRHHEALDGGNALDSAPFVPKSVVTPEGPLPGPPGPRIAWADAIVYEANVRGYTMLHPAVPERDRGRFAGLTHAEVLAYLKALGITTIELQPAQAFIDERFLQDRGLRNLWGYNTIAFFAPEPRYAGEDPVAEFRAMVNAIHDAGLEVLLDVAYNHTGEGDGRGPTLCFRGLDNAAYYRLEPDDPARYINDTGCGNTVNADHPRVRELVLASLRYWHRDMGVDGFRFDLATILGRGARGFEPGHPLLEAIGTDPELASAHLVAEPWDPGPGGYQLGRFPARWSEWNDRYRDGVRQFWRGDDGQLSELARRLHGSADLFEANGRGPLASVNFVASHDGFTLLDSVSYAFRHNEANGELNADGHAHNLSCNHGVEGPTDNRVVQAMRRRHRINLLATLLLSQGVPMLLAGDEFGNSQAGNNNAYAQDNETGWVDWSGLASDPEFTQAVRDLLALRRRLGLLRQDRFVHGRVSDGDGWRDIDWIRPDGAPMGEDDWFSRRALLKLLSGPEEDVALLVNGHDREVTFELPGERPWALAFSSDLAAPGGAHRSFRSAAWSIACLTRGADGGEPDEH